MELCGVRWQYVGEVEYEVSCENRLKRELNYEEIVISLDKFSSLTLKEKENRIFWIYIDKCGCSWKMVSHIEFQDALLEAL